MNINPHVALAAGLVAIGVAMPNTAIAQADTSEPEPMPENCPCACSWAIIGNGPVCDIFDFLGFVNDFAAGDPCAIDKDTSTGVGVGDIFDFLVFQHEFINSMYGNC